MEHKGTWTEPELAFPAGKLVWGVSWRVGDEGHLTLFWLFPDTERTRREGGRSLCVSLAQTPFMLSQLNFWEDDIMDDTERKMSQPQESQKTHSGWLDYIEGERP